LSSLLSLNQSAAMTGVGVLLWVIVALMIRAFPDASLDPAICAGVFAGAVPAGVASVAFVAAIVWAARG
jgi:hypothetical protein